MVYSSAATQDLSLRKELHTGQFMKGIYDELSQGLDSLNNETLDTERQRMAEDLLQVAQNLKGLMEDNPGVVSEKDFELVQNKIQDFSKLRKVRRDREED